ncbi:MAG: hypothetical protein J6J44_08235 [Lachnospiraceae bacterium]|nr:hypothetical protein [Lachnospiraceae bacterium]
MKKAFILFVCIFVLGLAGICVLPGYILKEAENVTLSEQVVLGDREIVEGVTVNTANDSMRHLLWTTELVAGKEPETEFEFSARERRPAARLAGQAWLEQSKYSCISLKNRLGGGWHVGSTGNLALDGSNIGTRGLEQAFQELAEATAPGEEKSRQIFLDNYMEYFPVVVSLEQVWEEEDLSEAYSEFFKIPVPKSAAYTITLKKDKRGNIVGIGGNDGGNNIFSWRTVCTRSKSDCYFTFYRYSADGTRMNTELIPGGFGVYKQPYALGAEGVYMNPEELSMVYSLEEETYPYGNMFLDINAAGQLLIITDTENSTKLQVVDVTTMEQIRQMEFPRPEGATRFESVVRVKDDFLLLSYRDGYFALIDWNEEQGYQHQFTMQVTDDDPLYWSAYIQENDMDWNGTQLLYVSCTDRQTMQGSCDFTLSVYDASGKIYHGEYKSSLITEQERELLYGGTSIEPWSELPIAVSWPQN